MGKKTYSAIFNNQLLEGLPFLAALNGNALY